MPDTITFKIKRQDSENTKPYWETFVIPHVPNSNVISCLMDIQANPENSKGEKSRTSGLGMQLPGRSLRFMHNGD